MIKLLGFTIKNKKILNGDIEIKIIGLRPGEKLYEELLIGDNPQKPIILKLQKINDPFIPFNKLELKLKKLDKLIEKNKPDKVKQLLNKIINSYKSNSKIVDHIYCEKNKNYK